MHRRAATFGRFVARHRSASATALVGVAVAALVVTVGVVSHGFVQQRVQLSDAAVWVTNTQTQMLARANTQVSALNSAVAVDASSLDVVQSGSTVLLVNGDSNTVARVDVSTVTSGKAISLPPRDAQVGLAGDRAVISSLTTGQLWIVPVADLGQFSATSTATVDVGGRMITSLAPDGTLFTYEVRTGTVSKIDAAHDDTVSQTWRTRPVAAADRAALQLTSVGGQWVLYDPAQRVLRTADGTRRLPGTVGSDGVLQQASTGAGVVAVASASGIVTAPLTAGGGISEEAQGSRGVPAAPVRVDGCLYAAWSSGDTWRSCDERSPIGATFGAGTASGTLPGMKANPTLEFRVNSDTVVLNDTTHGTSWSVQHDNAVIDNWSDFASPHDDTTQPEENVEDTPPTYEKTEQPPVAVDDHFGARPGTTTTLPVLLNDFDPNGDVLIIDSFTPVPLSVARIDRTDDDQQLQITLPTTAIGQIGFEYTISDGRGGQASAHVTVTVRQPDQNAAPVQARITKATVAEGGRVTAQVLGDWYDPDGDPFYLIAASVAAPSQVTFTPQGTVVINDRSGAPGMLDVTLTVSDGRLSGTGILALTVHPPTDVPIIADPFAVIVQAGAQTTINPLDHVRGGVGPVRLSAVPDKPDVTLNPDFDDGTIGFVSATPGTHYIDYTVTDGATTASGEVRVVVNLPQDAGDTPVTVPHTAFIEEQSTQELDVLATDFDPAGGVLLVTNVDPPAAATGVQVEVLARSILRITLTRPLEEHLTFGYTVSNGTAQAAGSVHVVEIPRPSVKQPPVANPDTATVRVGDALDIPVLENDQQADGDQLTLDPTLPTPLPRGAGLLFASGNVLRYLAPDHPGDYTAVYRVDDADGQWATAQVTLHVREIDLKTNRPPVPQTVTARVIAGGTVRVPIPLDGVDPDGDSVKLVGQSSNPQKGAVTAVGTDWIDYKAGAYSAGTDSFTYTLVDALGAHADGTVLVGIAPAGGIAPNPVALEDDVEVRPGRTVSVQVLANDSDPDGSPLHVVKVERTSKGIANATISGQVVKVAAPQTQGRYGFIYTIENDTGGTSSNFLTVTVSKDAPLARPIVSDTVLGLSDILDRTSVTVRPLNNVFFADGPVSSLKLSIVPGYGDTAKVIDGGRSGSRVRVQILAKAQIIPFEVANPDDASIASYGFLWIPGFNDALPQLKPSAPALTVQSEKTLVINLDDYVVVAAGRHLRITNAANVQATHANGAPLVRDDHTLVYTSAARYFGPASIAFEVTDGTSASDPNAHIVTLVLPITVTPRTNQPPTFVGAQVEAEPGQQLNLDLVKLTSYPYAGDAGELSYSVLDPKPAQASVSVQGQSLSVQVSDSTPKGTVFSIIVGVHDATNQGAAGRVDVTVVPSTRPLAIAQPDTVVARRGATTTVDVLANDQATNPFPGTPLRIIAVRGVSDASLPPGLHVTPSASGSVLTVSVDSSAQPIDTTLQYEVADATGDPSRYTWGTITISVQDRPAPVSNVHLVGVGDRQLTVAWDAGAFNNSPITGYTVTLTAGGQTVGHTSCQATTCAVQTPGNGPANAVTVSVTATNAIGVSDPVAYSDLVWSNIVPGAPQNLTVAPGDQSVQISWSAPAAGSGASAVTQYQVTVGSNVQLVLASTTNLTVSGLANGQPVQVSVASMNSFYGVQPAWNTAGPVTATPAGLPVWSSAPAVTPNNDAAGTVTVSWAGLVNANGAAITGYTVSCAGAQGPGVTSASCTLPVGQASSITVTATNSVGSTVSPAASATPPAPPATPSSVQVSVADPSAGVAGRFAPVFQGVSPVPSGSGGTVSYRVSLDGGATWQTLAPGSAIPLNADQYGVPLQVSVQVAVTYSNGAVLTSGWSRATFAGVAVDATLAGYLFTPATTGSGGTFSWTGAPGSPPYDSVQISCGTGPVSGNSCTTSSPNPVLTVTVTANGGRTYQMAYPGNMTHPDQHNRPLAVPHNTQETSTMTDDIDEAGIRETSTMAAPTAQQGTQGGLTDDQVAWFAETVDAIVGNVERVLLGKAHVVRLAVTALLSEGHLLLEDVPGTGKTSLARALAESISGSSGRIQFTPDLLPGDITGVGVYDQRSGTFEFHPGPVFANVVLADEINRASPKTQSALLEVMEERQVSVDGVTHRLDAPFMVIATQNPVEQAGTYRLPEAQLDRFIMKTSIGYPDHASMVRILEGADRPAHELTLPTVVMGDMVTTLSKLARRVHVDPTINDYVSRLVDATRAATEVQLGVSVRGGLALIRTAKTYAAGLGRSYVIPDDVKTLAEPVLSHRIMLDPEAEFDGVTAQNVVADVVLGTPPPLDGRTE